VHVPDGLIAPPVYFAAAAVAVPLWIVAVRKVARSLDEELIPRMAVVTALAFVLSSVMIPLPGGTSAHFSGVGLLTIVFGLWPAFLAFSGVLLLQVLLLGMGGITTLPLTALSLGLIGGGVTLLLHRFFQSRGSLASVALPVATGVVCAAAVMALVLGAQPAFGSDANGQPLYFPFGIGVTLPVMVLPHLAIGAAEGALSAVAVKVIRRQPAAAAPDD
jgi:cobalt/nickel transport system permease protein